jgi:hypothetical protein
MQTLKFSLRCQLNDAAISFVKKSFFTVAALAFGLFACAQTPPAQVNDSFNKKFAGATKVKWDKENNTEWEAEFKLSSGKEYSANFSNEGKWMETEHEIKKSAIPAKVKQTLDSEFADYDVKEAEISETAEGSVYEFVLEKNESEMEVAISPEGKVVKKEMKTEKEEEGKRMRNNKFSFLKLQNYSCGFFYLEKHPNSEFLQN